MKNGLGGLWWLTFGLEDKQRQIGYQKRLWSRKGWYKEMMGWWSLALCKLLLG